MAIVTISRGTYSGGKDLAEHISNKLGYRLLSREELLTNTAKEFGVSEEKLETALMNKPGFLEGLNLRRIHYVAYVQVAMSKAVQDDNVVYHGQSGHLLLKGAPHQLRIKVVTSMETRIEAAMKRNGYTREKAIKFLREIDEGRDKWVKNIYGVDRNDPSTYDLIINLERISIENACEIVCQTINMGFQTTPEAQKILNDMVIAAEIRAKVAMDRKISDDNIEIEVKDGIVTLMGTVRSLGDADDMRALVRELPGVKDIVSKMGTRW